MQDFPDDVGSEPNLTTYDFCVSQDIWVRNQSDGITNQVHQNPEYNQYNPVYVYVRVRNKSIVPSKGNGKDKLHLYWSKAGITGSWPAPWDGSMNGAIPMGNELEPQVIPVINPGEEVILKFEWHMPNPELYAEMMNPDEIWHYCLVARIESEEDPITFTETTHLGYNLIWNNNIISKNVTIVDNVIDSPGKGGLVWLANFSGEHKKFRLHFKIPVTEMEHPITNEAEVSLRLSEGLYRAWEIMGHEGKGIKDIGKYKVLITEPDAYLEFELHPEEFHTVYAGFNFLTQKITEKPTFECFLELECQIEGEEYETLGGEQYIINKWERDLFKANAGNDKLVSKNESIQLQARSISETATYNWYDINDSLLYTGKDFTTATGQTQKYKLEVIAEKDGYKDYDEVTVKVKEFEIKRLSPNPARTDLTVEYDAQNAASVYLYVYNANGIWVRTILLNPQSDSITFNVSNYQQGSYSIALVCNGQITDSKTFVVN